VNSVFINLNHKHLKVYKVGVYLPPAALEGKPCSALFYLAGLTCTEETFAIKAHAQRMAAQLSLILITPDTSPRGEQVAVGDHWDLVKVQAFISMPFNNLGLSIIKWKVLFN
jgi:S-formylglutathione hydrolase